jgi:hypothetical protein
MENSTLFTIFLLLIFGYIILYFGGRKYLENFDNRFDSSGRPNERVIMTQQPPEKPYMIDPIESVDEYEIGAVFQNRGSMEASKRQISDAMTRYPMDWSNQGPDSQYFQEEQAKSRLSAKPQAPLGQDTKNSDMMLPDSAEQDDEERKILQTYQPKHSKDLLHYSVQDVKAMLHKIYGKKGLIPVVVQSKQGPNIWEVTEVKEKNPKIVWEDDDPKQDVMRDRGEEVITVPMAASDMAAGLDPFFQARESTRMGKHDYTRFTPGLERMFAPTYPIPSWF